MICSDKKIIGPWVAKKVFGSFNPNSEAIGILNGDRVTAGVLYEGWNHRSITCHIAVDGPMTPRFLAAIFHYPFVHLGVDKILAPVSEGNERSIRLVEKLGFRLEARLLDFHPDGSLLLYTMKPEQCRFIGQRYQQRLGVEHGQRQLAAAGT